MTFQDLHIKPTPLEKVAFNYLYRWEGGCCRTQSRQTGSGKSLMGIEVLYAKKEKGR
jgi:hypothetical protein